MIIYTITNKKNQKQYVGKTTQSLDSRVRGHKAQAKVSSYPLYRAIRKYGIGAFLVEQVDTATTPGELNEKEKLWITQLNTATPNGYNLTLGGDGGTLHLLTQEQKRARAEKISKALTGRIRTPDHSKAISEARQGKGGSKPGTMTEQGKRNVGASAKQRMTGRVVSETTREKLCQSHTGVKFTEERKAAISESKKGKPAWNKGKPGPLASEETRRKMSEAHKARWLRENSTQP